MKEKWLTVLRLSEFPSRIAHSSIHIFRKVSYSIWSLFPAVNKTAGSVFRFAHRSKSSPAHFQPIYGRKNKVESRRISSRNWHRVVPLDIEFESLFLVFNIVIVEGRDERTGRALSM